VAMTRMPRESNTSAQMLPMYPAAPVTRIFICKSPGVGAAKAGGAQGHTPRWQDARPSIGQQSCNFSKD
jgi:hypothetical protein